jgi:hypothetical protein
VTFLPRPAISLVDPVDADNPWSSRFTITNNAWVPLTDVLVGIHPQHVRIGNSEIISPKRKKGDTGTVFILSSVDWDHLYLAMDDSFAIPMSDVIGPKGFIKFNDPGDVKEADFSVIVRYNPWFIPLRRAKEFRFHAYRETNGKVYWKSVLASN